MSRLRKFGYLALLAVILSLFGCADPLGSLQSSELMATEISVAQEATDAVATEGELNEVEQIYVFRNQDLFDQHYNKHGREFGEISQEAYLRLANVLFNSDVALKKTEADGDALFYDEASNTFGVLSQDGYIRTFFKPDDGLDYWNRQ